jgi:hypothetical protein
MPKTTGSSLNFSCHKDKNIFGRGNGRNEMDGNEFSTINEIRRLKATEVAQILNISRAR